MVAIIGRMTTKPHPFADPMTRRTPAFLEEIEGDEALAWVRTHNARTEATLADGSDLTPSVAELEAQILSVLDSPDRIPMVRVRGQWAYNFWTDNANPRGLWRRQRLDDYLAHADRWEVLVDVDALAKKEGKSWVWHGAAVCPPNYERALITLSDGGSDADETREFDLSTLQWVEGGFYRPEGKGSLTWIDEDLCWLSQPMGPDSTSASGYPLQARLLRRGQALEDAPIILTGDASAMGVWATAVRDGLGTRSLIQVSDDFYNSSTYLLDGDPHQYTDCTPTKIPVPQTAEVFVWNQWVGVWLREAWHHAGTTYPAGALLALRTGDLLANPTAAKPSPLFLPTANEVLESVTTTANHVVVTSIVDVVSAVSILTPPKQEGEGEWERSNLPVPQVTQNTRDKDGGEEGQASSPSPSPRNLVTVSVSAVDRVHDNRLWVVTTGYAQPSALWLMDADLADAPELVYQAPDLFDNEGVEVTQHFVVSKDGTRVPYFQVRKGDAPMPAPTLLYGYGGFNVSLLPAYAPAVGKAWLERGGTYVVANIRGGGEYGPDWHMAALKENRHRAYEDFVAVARDLCERGVTTRSQLGAQGGSNGGLLMGNMYTQYPGDFGAILCQVPLLDMGRYHTLLAGHSWMAEYGDPTQPEQWEYIRSFSPIHLFDKGGAYPPLMITTSTKDDRVHPGHARSLGFLAQDSGKDVLYFENIEGGHGGAADNRQRAHNQALGWAFLWSTLGSAAR